MYYINSYFFIRELFKRLSYGFYRTLYIRLDYYLQLFHFAELHLVEQIVERYFCPCIETLLLFGVTSLCDKLSCKTLIGYCIEDVSACRNIVKTGYLYRYRRTGSLYLCTTAFLPLGLPADDPFWSAPARDWTSKKAWSGIDVGSDHAL